MFVKQISMNEALKLASKGQKILIMVPTFNDGNGWGDYMPDTLQGLLNGCLFFRQEAAMEVWDELEEGCAVGLESQPEKAAALGEQLRRLPEAPKNRPPDVWISVKRGKQ